MPIDPLSMAIHRAVRPGPVQRTEHFTVDRPTVTIEKGDEAAHGSRLLIEDGAEHISITPPPIYGATTIAGSPSRLSPRMTSSMPG